MYTYNPTDTAIVKARVDEFRDQVTRYKAGQLDDATFLQLRLRNGLYLQRHDYMLRVAIPYGMLRSGQLRTLAHIARTYDKGYGHLTTRQNMQFNHPQLDDVPDILDVLADAEMHAIQTSGNCVRNTSADELSGVARDESVDPRPYAEMIRQWSTFHPEFNDLPRKFKIAITGSEADRAAIRFHDIGLRARQTTDGVRFTVWVGGGLGRTPVIGKELTADLAATDLLAYIEAILRVYNLRGNREKKYRARIKILVRTMGAGAFKHEVDTVFAGIRGGDLALTDADIAHFAGFFTAPAYKDGLEADVPPHTAPGYAAFVANNVIAHRVAGYSAVVVTVKGLLADGSSRAPGDLTAAEMDAIADLADRFSFGELRTTHVQNLVLADVPTRELPALFDALQALGLAEGNRDQLTDMICCPGLDFCSLANAESLSVADALTQRFIASDKAAALGDIKLKMSGCVNACGHHHVGHIGILGVDKKGVQGYQILLGGDASDDARIGKWIGRALPREALPDAIDAILDVAAAERRDGERFIDTVKRLGNAPFAAAVYGPPAR